MHKEGRYSLHIFALTEEPSTLKIDVNDQNVGKLEWRKSGEQTICVYLKKGKNVVRLWNDESRMPDVDYMKITTCAH